MVDFDSISNIIRGSVDLFIDILRFLLFAGPSAENEALLMKGLLFALLVIVLHAAAKKVDFFKGFFLSWIVSIIVSILAIRYLAGQALLSILLPYSALGIAISVLIPFILLIAAMNALGEGVSRYVRRIGYIFFAAAMVGLWIYRWDDLGVGAYIYLGAAIAGFIMLAMDGTLHMWFLSMKMGKQRAETMAASFTIIEHEIRELTKALGSATPAERKKILKQIKERREALKDIRDVVG